MPCLVQSPRCAIAKPRLVQSKGKRSFGLPYRPGYPAKARKTPTNTFVGSRGLLPVSYAPLLVVFDWSHTRIHPVSRKRQSKAFKGVLLRPQNSSGSPNQGVLLLFLVFSLHFCPDTGPEATAKRLQRRLKKSIFVTLHQSLPDYSRSLQDRFFRTF